MGLLGERGVTFKPGDNFELGGVHFRFVQGRKDPDDVRMDLLIPRWVPVSMKLGYVMADFYAQNERVLYPYRGDKAGDRYIIACQVAQFAGWEEAAAQLDYEREQAAARRKKAA